jgi:hypothetical protein
MGKWLGALGLRWWRALRRGVRRGCSLGLLRDCSVGGGGIGWWRRTGVFAALSGCGGTFTMGRFRLGFEPWDGLLLARMFEQRLSAASGGPRFFVSDSLGRRNACPTSFL